MSVNKNHYVMLGMKFELEEFFDLCIESGAQDTTSDQWDEGDLMPFIDSSRGGIKCHDYLTVIIDGMSGMYVYLGHVIKKSDYEDGNLNDYVAEDTWVIAVEEDGGIHCDMGSAADEVYTLIMENFGLEFANRSVNLHCFTHRS